MISAATIDVIGVSNITIWTALYTRLTEYYDDARCPALEIKRLLAENPKVLGLAVPAMPLGSPGMDGPEYKGKKDPYEVLVIGLNGAASVYQAYR